MLDRRAFVKELLRDRKELLVVGGLGSPTFDIAACGDHPLNFYLWGAMGGTAMVGLGLALARPDRRVAVFTGDGDALMGLGSLATIGVQRPRNLALVVLDNGHYGETGMQPSHTSSGIDLAGVARSCGFTIARQATDMSQCDEVRSCLHSGQGPALIQARVKAEDAPRVLPTRDGHEIALRFRRALDS